MTKIILVRHGHVDGIMPHRFRGRVDLQLTSIGQEQARRTAMRIESAWRPARIYSSPMSRSIATGRAIGARFSLNVETDAGLNDLDFGNWQGLTPVEARSRWPNEFDTWFRAPHLANIPEGESLQTVLARVTATLRTILSRHPNDVVVLVGHDSVNRIILLHAMDLPLSRYWRLRQDPCSINEVNFSDGEFTLGSLNETWHLHCEHPAESADAEVKMKT